MPCICIYMESTTFNIGIGKQAQWWDIVSNEWGLFFSKHSENFYSDIQQQKCDRRTKYLKIVFAADLTGPCNYLWMMDFYDQWWEQPVCQGHWFVSSLWQRRFRTLVFVRILPFISSGSLAFLTIISSKTFHYYV